MRIHITTPLWRGPRTGTARPAFGRGRYHVQLDGEPRKADGRLDCPACAATGVLPGPPEALDRSPNTCPFCSGGGAVIRYAARDLLFTRDEMVREDGGRL
jgi:hypothetical protein